ncbi:MAG: von Willebrand factor type A domain-containing protein [Verrucomicrobiales bacterium]
MNDQFKSQLTSLALDEIGPEQRTALEATLAATPEARVYVDKTRTFCALLGETFGATGDLTLTDSQRDSLSRQLSESSSGAAAPTMSFVSHRNQWMGWVAGLGAAAAALAVTHHLWFDQRSSSIVMGAKPGSTAPLVVVQGGATAATDSTHFANQEGFREADGSNALALNEELRLGKTRADAPADPATFAGPAEAKQLEKSDQRRDNLSAVDGGAVSLGDDAVGRALAAEASRPLAEASMLRLQAISGEAASEDGLAGDPGETVDAVDASASPFSVAAVPADTAGAIPIGGLPAPATEPANLAASEPASRLGLGAPQPGATQDAPADAKPLASRRREESIDQSQTRYFKRQVDSYEELAGASRDKLPESELLSRGAGFPLTPATPGTEDYAEVPENPFLAVASSPLSTFSVDVDTAAYANVRRFLNQGQRPPRAAVRLEEMINYFRYDYPQPAGDTPFSVTVDMVDCPWQPQHRLARIGLQGKSVTREQRPAANLVFLVDVSGSMDEPNKLPLVKQSLHLLTSQLKGSDHVAIVTYAGQSGVALPSTSLEQKESVTRAIEALAAGGSTNGASGLQLSYQQARQHFKPGGVNRVLLATDGDFNVGITSRTDLETLITKEAQSGVFLSVLGYGMGNLKDATMELLADKGNGNYAYIDSLSEARKVLADQLDGTLTTIAKDVKIQIEFNPAQVRHYRLLGYENRLLAREDFNDDKKDAGEIGAGHSVTALYEIVPIGAAPPQPPVDPLKYQPVPAAPVATAPATDKPVSREAMTVKLRYKAPEGTESRLIEVPVVDSERRMAEAPGDFKFAAAVAMTGLLLKDSAHKGSANWNMVRDLARAGKGQDPEGYRGEFLQLMEKAAGVVP